MSSVAKGAARVGSAMTQFAKLDYRCARVSASGQRKGERRDEKCLAGDLIALAPTDRGFPHVIAEIGGEGKRLRAAFEELHAEPLPPNFVALVGRVVRRRWRWHVDPSSRYHNTLRAALESLT
jgi:hypothetical protein